MCTSNMRVLVPYIFFCLSLTVQANDSSGVLIVHEEPMSKDCRYVGEIKNYDFAVTVNDRLAKLYENTPKEKTSSYLARKLNGNLIYVRKKQLQENEAPPKEYADTVVTVSHGLDYYYLEAWVYSCNENT